MTYEAGAIYACIVQQPLLEKIVKSLKFSQLKSTICAVSLGMASMASFAAPAPSVLDPNNPCGLTNWAITGAIPSAFYPGGGAVPTFPTPISATSCAGVFDGNDGATLNPDPNLGYLNDGLLNGQDGLLSPTQFIAPSQLLDLKTPGAKVDPGWVMLGQMDGLNAGELTYSSVKPVGQPVFNLGSVLKYTQTQTSNVGGTWLLEVDKDIVSILSNAGLFSRSTFDHLAFEVKSSTSWAVYDFDFNQFAGFDLSVPYTIKGTWTMNGDFETNNPNNPGVDQNISHMSVWARDPLSDNTVPLPGTVFLVGIGLLALGVAMKRTTS